MSRNADEGFELYQKWYKAGVELVFLREPQINTSTYKESLQNSLPRTGTEVDFILEGVDKFLFEIAKKQIKIAFDKAQSEVDQTHQRTKEGIREAKLRGKMPGRPRGALIITAKEKQSANIIQTHSKDFGGTLSDKETMILCGVTAKTYYKYKKHLKETN